MKKINWWTVKFGRQEINEISKSIMNKNISQGLQTKRFENEIGRILKKKYVTATVNGTTAILMSMMVAGVKPGDEVIIPNRNWIACVNAAYLLRAKIILVDSLPDKQVVDIEKLEKKINRKTKIIIITYLNGTSVDIDRIKKTIKRKKSKALIIEDSAQALISKNPKTKKFLGTTSFAGCFSLSVSKIIATGQGGFIISNDKKSYDALQIFRTHSTKDINLPKFDKFGFNFRYNDILSSFGLVQLKKLNSNRLRAIEIYKNYIKKLKDINEIKFLFIDTKNGEVPVYVEAIVRNRNSLVKYLNKYGIYPRLFYKSMHNVAYIKNSGKFKNSDNFEKNGIYFPSGPGLKKKDQEYVIKKIRDYYKG